MTEPDVRQNREFTIRAEGGPAFPFSGNFSASPGMSLRAWYAGQALAALITLHQGSDCDDIAENAFNHADAMLRAAHRKEIEG